MRFLLLSLVVLSIGACDFLSSQHKSHATYKPNQVEDLPAPDTFVFMLSTNKGDVSIQAIRDWSPKGVDRLYHLIQEGYYDSCSIFRVQKGYVAQFGIAAKPEVSQYWREHPISDEKVRVPNLRGTVSYAREGSNSRDTQLFINLDDNFKLDTIEFMGLRGFPPIGRVLNDSNNWAVIEKWYGEKGFEPANHQEEMYKQGNSYVKKNYPKLDYVLEVKLKD